VAKWSVAGALAALVMILGWVPGVVRAGTPGSDPRNGQWVGGLVLQPGPEQLVVWKLPGTNGAVGTCIDAHLAGPLRGPYSAVATIDDAVYGELNHLFASASTSDVRLAELSALNSAKYDRVDRSEQWSYLQRGTGGTSVADANAMLAAATKLAGPYSVSVALPAGELAPASTNAADVTIRSASGALVPDARISLSATGISLSTSTIVTNSAGKATVRFTVPASGGTSYQLRASVQSWTTLRVYDAPGEQKMLSAGPPSTQQGAATGQIQHDRVVQLVKAAADDQGATPVPGYTYRITDDTGAEVAPPVTSAATAGAAQLGRLRLGVRYHATEVSGPRSGGSLYVPDKRTFDFTVPAGSGAWTLVARDPRMPTPTVTTRVGESVARIGARLSDVVIVTGNDGENATITAARYGPVHPPASGACADVPLTTYLTAPSHQYSIPVDGSVNGGNGQFTVVGDAVATPGCYGWAETLRLMPSGATATSPPTAPHESTLVPAPPAPAVRPPAPAAHPPAAAPPVIVQAVPKAPVLAATGTRMPVTATVGIGVALVGFGCLALVGGRRRRAG
jgi:hypothetical protein